MLNSFVLCCNFCACKCACTVGVWSPGGGVGDRHLVTIPQGVVGDRLPWGGERQGGGEGTQKNSLPPPPRQVLRGRGGGGRGDVHFFVGILLVVFGPLCLRHQCEGGVAPKGST